MEHVAVDLADMAFVFRGVGQLGVEMEGLLKVGFRFRLSEVFEDVDFLAHDERVGADLDAVEPHRAPPTGLATEAGTSFEVAVGALELAFGVDARMVAVHTVGIASDADHEMPLAVDGGMVAAAAALGAVPAEGLVVGTPFSPLRGVELSAVELVGEDEFPFLVRRRATDGLGGDGGGGEDCEDCEEDERGEIFHGGALET